MHPILLDLGTYDLPLLGETRLALPTYGVLFALGAVWAWWWFLRRARTLGLPEEPLFNLGFYSLLSGLLGAKLLLVVVEWKYYLAEPVRILGTIRSAGVLLGGVVTGAFVFIWYCRRQGLPVWTLADAIAAPLALAQAIGRLACFSAGCCWGVPTEHPWFSVTFSHPEAQVQTEPAFVGVPLVPVQLLEASADLILVGILTWLWRRRPEPPGTVLWVYVIGYGTIRTTLEFWRGDAIRGLWLGNTVSTSQLLSLAGIALAVVMLVLHRRRRREP